MADLDNGQVFGPAIPDLSNLEAVIINVQTVNGDQYSMVIATEGKTLSMDVEEYDRPDDDTKIFTLRRT